MAGAGSECGGAVRFVPRGRAVYKFDTWSAACVHEPARRMGATTWDVGGKLARLQWQPGGPGEAQFTECIGGDAARMPASRDATMTTETELGT